MAIKENLFSHYVPLGAAGIIMLTLFSFAVKVGGYVERFETAAVDIVKIKKLGEDTAAEVKGMKLTFRQDVIGVVEEKFFNGNSK